MSARLPTLPGPSCPRGFPNWVTRGISLRFGAEGEAAAVSRGRSGRRPGPGCAPRCRTSASSPGGGRQACGSPAPGGLCCRSCDGLFPRGTPASPSGRRPQDGAAPGLPSLRAAGSSVRTPGPRSPIGARRPRPLGSCVCRASACRASARPQGESGWALPRGARVSALVTDAAPAQRLPGGGGAGGAGLGHRGGPLPSGWPRPRDGRDAGTLGGAGRAPGRGAVRTRAGLAGPQGGGSARRRPARALLARAAARVPPRMLSADRRSVSPGASPPAARRGPQAAARTRGTRAPRLAQAQHPPRGGARFARLGPSGTP